MKKIIEQMRTLGLNPRKEGATLALLDLFLVLSGVGLFLFLKEAVVFLYAFMVIVIFDGLYLGRYGKALNLIFEKKEEDFVTLFSFFSIFIANGFNVYSALKVTLPYCPKSLKEGLGKLIEGIDEDKSVAPFLAFSTQFSSLSIKEVLLSVYQMVDEGGGQLHLARFTYLFHALSEDKRKMKKAREAASLASLSSFPLMGSGIAMLMLTVAISQIMGGLFNVA